MINEAKENIYTHTTHKICKLHIGGKCVDSEVKCEGVKLTEGKYDIKEKYILPKMKYAFIFRIMSNDIDLMRFISEQNYVEIDGLKYYNGDFKFLNEIIELKFIIYDLVESMGD